MKAYLTTSSRIIDVSVVLLSFLRSLRKVSKGIEKLLSVLCYFVSVLIPRLVTATTPIYYTRSEEMATVCLQFVETFVYGLITNRITLRKNRSTHYQTHHLEYDVQQKVCVRVRNVTL